jgi:hypothetical protein
MFSAVADQTGVQTGTENAAPASDQRLRRRAWLLAFLAFFLLIGAWSVAAPYDGFPDEQDHILRAAGVAAGQVVSPPVDAIRGGGAFQDVPKSLVRENCWRFKPGQSAACAVEPGGDSTLIHIGSAAGRYHPLYYALVGWPLVLSPDWTGVILARLLSAAMCAALLANALTDAMRWSKHRLMVAGVLVAATPMAAHIGGAVNPNGPEIAAGVAFFAAAIPLLLTDAGARSRTLPWHAGIAALALATLRAGGPLWLAVAVGVLLVPAGRERLRTLWSRRSVRWWVLGIGVAMAQSTGWSLAMKTTNMGDFTGGRHWSKFQATRLTLEYWRAYADEMVGVMSWLDASMPATAYLIWEGAVAALIGWGFVLAHRTGRWRLAALMAGGLGIPFVMQVAYVNKYGFITQGRYLLPVAVGLPILATFLIQEYGLPADKSRSLLRLFAIVLLPMHLVALIVTMGRWQRGVGPTAPLRSFNPLAGPWQPPLGGLLPVLATVAGVLLFGWLVWREGLARRPRPPAPAQVRPEVVAGDVVVARA